MAFSMLTCARRCAAALGLALISPVCFAAGVAVETNGFEDFALGNLQTQQGWVKIGAGAGTAVVQTAEAEFGDKSVKVDRAPNADNRWAVPLANAFPGRTFPANRFMLVSWDMAVIATGATNGAFGPFFGMEGYDDQGNPLGLLGSLGVDATTRDVLYQRQGDAAFIETGTVVASGEWNNFAVAFDFDMHRYTVFFNGQALATTGFVDRPGGVDLDQLTDADISALAAGGDTLSQSLAGTAYFDNFRVLDGIPGDNDFDGDVDNQDLAIWRSAYGTNALGDADGDGDTDGNDFVIWQGNLGADFSATVAAASAVPEPATMGLAAFAALGALHLARRRART